MKSYYASVECVERGLDPMTTNLVVADESRTDKTICLAVSPALKSLGISGRPRLFEVKQRVRQINGSRREQAPGKKLTGASWDKGELERSPELAVDFIVATPRMGHYISQSAGIYQIYTKYAAPEDIHVYSIDEVFLDATRYLDAFGGSVREYVRSILGEVMEKTGITATAGIGTNLYLAKVAMDIVAKHMPPDENGVRMAELDEMSYRRILWAHKPLTDFWRVGRGYAKKLAAYGIFTMGDIARCSLGAEGAFWNEDLLYRLFGVNAELLIDHAWGWESCTMADIKAYRPESSSMGSGQVLQSPYPADRARVVLLEMADQLALDLMEKGLAADQLTLMIGYDRESLEDPQVRAAYRGKVKGDAYGRVVPQHAHGTLSLGGYTSSAGTFMETAAALFDGVVDRRLLVRRLALTACHVCWEREAPGKGAKQLDLFTDEQKRQEAEKRERKEREKERRLQQAVLDIKKKYGKNAVLRGVSLEEGATARERNQQIGGHKA
nr:DNA methylase [Anaerotignum lactatifermentans]